MLTGLTAVAAYVNGIIVAGSNLEELLQCLNRLFDDGYYSSCWYFKLWNWISYFTHFSWWKWKGSNLCIKIPHTCWVKLWPDWKRSLITHVCYKKFDKMLYGWNLLLDYDFTIKYKLTDKIDQADVLSRLMDSQHKQPEDPIVIAVSVTSEVNTVLVSTIRSLPVTAAIVCEVIACNPLL